MSVSLKAGQLARASHIDVAPAAVAANVLEALDVHADCAPQIALCGVVIHLFTQLCQLLLAQILGPLVLHTLSVCVVVSSTGHDE